jgi:hypothetical protein
MKSDRRHELQTNELANWIGRQYERHQGQLPTILWGALAVVAVIVVIGVWGSRSSTSVASAWEEFYQIGNLDQKVRPKRLKELAEKFPNTEIALWARLDLADQLCYDGHAKLDIDRAIAATQLNEAQQLYALILKSPKAIPEMKRRAALAEAKCWELLGDREQAIESYRAVAKQFATSYPELSQDAASRASELEQPEAADFYKWLAEYEPPASRPLNLPGLGSLFPPAGDTLEKGRGSDDSVPGKEPAKPDAADSEEKESSEEKPKTELESPVSPSDSKSDDKPATGEKAPDGDPATPKPDAEKKPPEPSVPE